MTPPNPIRDEWTSPDGSVRLLLGDCLEILPTLEAGSVDCLLTDPPYCSGGYLEAQKNTKAQGLRGATVSADGFHWFQGDNMGSQGLLFLLRSVLVNCRRLMKQNRSAFIFTDWRMISTMAPGLESAGMRYRNMLVWDKCNAGLGVGFKPAHEVIMEFANGSTEYASLCGQNVLRCPRVSSQKKEHGAEKPVELLAEILDVATKQGGSVLDSFMGSATTGVACIRTGRRFIGIEIEPKYFEIAVQRCKRELGRFPLFEQPVKSRQRELL